MKPTLTVATPEDLPETGTPEDLVHVESTRTIYSWIAERSLEEIAIDMGMPLETARWLRVDAHGCPLSSTDTRSVLHARMHTSLWMVLP